MQQAATSRPFAWDDVEALHALVASRWTVDGPHGQRRIGDFWWALRNTPAGQPLRHMKVWAGGDGGLLGAAFLDPPALGDVILAPGAEGLFDEALTWLEGEHASAGGGALTIVALNGDDTREAELRRRGYAPGEGGNVRLWAALEAAPEAAPLAVGYSLKALGSDLDLERRAFVEAASFGADGITGDTWRSITSRVPGYRADLDVIAVAPDGSGASACTNWFDPIGRRGELEAVGTAPAHRRRGIGKAVIVESLQRLHGAGACQAIVETTIGNEAALALYRSCGFAEVARDIAWTKVSG